MPLKVIAAGRTDVGLHREHNEDSLTLSERHGLFLVADGMGGHRAGDVASKMALEAISVFFESTAREDATWPFHYDPSLSIDENRLITGIKVANRAIYEESSRNQDRRGMGTTVVGALFSTHAGKAFIAHVGDSRCYRVRGQSVSQLTHDHSLVNEYLRAMPDLTPAQRMDLPRNVITRALGMTDIVMVDLVVDEPRPGDLYVLCSDGLSGMITDGEILATVRAHLDPGEACQALIALANAHGGEDNITAVVVRVIDSDHRGRASEAPTEDTKITRLDKLPGAEGETDPDPKGRLLAETLPPPPGSESPVPPPPSLQPPALLGLAATPEAEHAALAPSPAPAIAPPALEGRDEDIGTSPTQPPPDPFGATAPVGPLPDPARDD